MTHRARENPESQGTVMSVWGALSRHIFLARWRRPANELADSGRAIGHDIQAEERWRIAYSLPLIAYGFRAGPLMN